MIKKIVTTFLLLPTATFALCPFGEAQQILQEYCHEISFEKYPGGSYYCRTRIEDDCKRDRTASACPLLTELRKLEESFLPEAGIEEKKGNRGTASVKKYVNRELAWHQRKDKRPKIQDGVNPLNPDFLYPIKVQYGSPDLERIPEDKWLEEGNSLASIKEKKELLKELKVLNKELNAEKVSFFCTENSDCQIQDLGRWGCGGPASSFMYSNYNGQPSFMEKIMRFTYLDREIQSGLRGWLSTCEYHGIPETPKCSLNQCTLDGPSM